MTAGEIGASRRDLPLRTWRSLLAATVSLAVIGAAQAADVIGKAKPPAPQSTWEQDKLTGDWGGARTALSDQGLDFTINYINEVFGVLSGGLERRASYEGRLELSADADLQKLTGWSGATAHVTVFQIHNSGHNVAENVGSIADPSNIDALPTTRLYTAWFEQNFNDKVSVRLGQLAADDEFFTSETAGGLINGTFGWASILAANMINGGPAYPLATPGVRVKVTPAENLSLLAAVFSGDPAGGDCNNDPQRCNRYGTTFSFSGGALWMGELQYGINQGKDAVGLPGVYKLGVWYETADFPDQRFGLNGAGSVISLADPTVAGPLEHNGNWGFYGIADQMVWRDGERSLNLFVRAGYAPPDRNLVTWYVDGGAGFKGLVPGRADDTLTFGVSYAKISGDVVGLDRDTLAINGAPYAVRDEEVVFELSYAAHIAKWWVVQPDLQYIIHPNGGQNPNDPTLSLDHAFVAGIRSTIQF
ncbi:MAG TPA: carbohydrate porin [Pseudolabrys sp.]|nr:carbohydrate porin [Pseudolabrys sp.]